MLDAAVPTSRDATDAAFRVGATTSIRRRCDVRAENAARSIVVLPVLAGPVTVTSPSVPAMAQEASPVAGNAFTCVGDDLQPAGRRRPRHAQ
jgi:hypothetical protein